MTVVNMHVRISNMGMRRGVKMFGMMGMDEGVAIEGGEEVSEPGMWEAWRWLVLWEGVERHRAVGWR